MAFIENCRKFPLIIGESLRVIIADGEDRSEQWIDESKKPGGGGLFGNIINGIGKIFGKRKRK